MLLREHVHEPQPSSETGQDGQGSLSTETSILRLPGPWGLPTPPQECTPHSWEVPHPLQHRLWSGLPGPCLSPGHPVSPTWALTSCPSAFKASLLLWSALLTSPSSAPASLPREVLPALCPWGHTPGLSPPSIIPSTADKVTSGQ